MGEYRSIFSEEWRDCLRAHYRYVIRAQDTLTEQTLRQVLMQTGMGEDELLDLQRQALGYDPSLTPSAEAEIDEIDLPADELIEQIAPPAPVAPPASEEPPTDLLDDEDEDDLPPASSSQLSMF